MRLAPLTKAALALATCAALAACSSGGDRSDARGLPRLLIPEREAEIFAAAETWTPFATDPVRRDRATDPIPPTEDGIESEHLRDYTILGRAELDDPDARRELIESLNAGIRANDDMVAACFDPRHALRAETEAGSAELLICFECLQLFVYTGDGERKETVLTSKLPAATFDRIFEAHGLTIAPRW